MSLEFIATAFRLSDVELGDLFRVSRRTIRRWRHTGASPNREADVDEIRDLAEFLERRFITERFAGDRAREDRDF